MAWSKPQYSRTRVDKAGDEITRSEDFMQYVNALGVVNNWRASHQYPLNTFQMTLRRKAQKIDKLSIVAQRIKRFESIHRKLESGTMKLTQMQDIGGCRAIMSDCEGVYRLKNLYEKAGFDHVMIGEKDYILSPKDDGYRSLHLIYRYIGTPMNSHYSGLKIEIQIRSQLQHAWATAVEAVGTFTKQALKWRGGNADWQRFFLLMSGAIAEREGAPLPPGIPASMYQLSDEVRLLSSKLHVSNALKAYNITISYLGQLEERKARLLLVRMQPDEERVEIRGFRVTESQIANMEYDKLEKAISEENSADQAVLVRVDSVKALPRAYPNLFLDTQYFSNLVDEVCQEGL